MAEFESYTRIDERTISDPNQNPCIGKSWYSDGKNHRVENGHIKRDFDDKDWFININSLEELIVFVNNHGSIVVNKCMFNDRIFSIEIYDGYRE